MPIGTAGVERSFSTMNRVLNSARCRLLPDHVNSFMQISIEGPRIPESDIRDGTEQEDEDVERLIKEAVRIWNLKLHR